MSNKLHKTIEVSGLIAITIAGILTACQPAAAPAKPVANVSNGGIIGKTENYQIRLFVSQGYGSCFVLEDGKGEPKFLQCN